MANAMTMGDAASLSREGRGVIRQQGDAPREEMPINPEPTQLLDEIDVAEAPGLAKVDLTIPSVAIAEGLERDAPPLEADFPLERAPRGPLYAPTGPVIPARFDPREWTLIKGNWLSTPEPLAGTAPGAPIAATLGGILKDGFGRRVRSGTGSFVRTGRYGRE